MLRIYSRKMRLLKRSNLILFTTIINEYTLKDHLGNGRVFFSDTDKDGIVEVAQGGNHNELLQQEHYYPFGMPIRGEWKFVQPQVGGINNYQYNGKELNDDFGLNWNDYGARWYDASIARWNAVDPLAEKYSPWSSCNYVLGNPIKMIDLDGRDAIIIIGAKYPSGGVPGTGHAGVLLIDNKTGKTKYYEYGRYDSENNGMVRSYSVPNVKMDENGRPTLKSLNKTLNVIAKKSFRKKGKIYDLSGAYFEHDDFDGMKKYAEERKAQGTKGDPYSVLTNNCGDFTCEVVQAGEGDLFSDALIEFENTFLSAPSALINGVQSASDDFIEHSSDKGYTGMGYWWLDYFKKDKKSVDDSAEKNPSDKVFK